MPTLFDAIKKNMGQATVQDQPVMEDQGSKIRKLLAAKGGRGANADIGASNLQEGAALDQANSNQLMNNQQTQVAQTQVAQAGQELQNKEQQGRAEVGL